MTEFRRVLFRSLSKAGQPDGKYSTDKILDLTDACEVSFPDLYDGECTPK